MALSKKTIEAIKNNGMDEAMWKELEEGTSNRPEAFFVAAENGRLEILNRLLELIGDDVEELQDAIHYSFNASFQEAIGNGHLEVAELLLGLASEERRHEMIHDRDDRAFWLAAHSGRLKSIKFLIKETPNPEDIEKMIYQRGGLKIAVSERRLEVVEHLIQFWPPRDVKTFFDKEIRDGKEKNFLLVILGDQVDLSELTLTAGDQEKITKLRELKGSLVKSFSSIKVNQLPSPNSAANSVIAHLLSDKNLTSYREYYKNLPSKNWLSQFSLPEGLDIREGLIGDFLHLSLPEGLDIREGLIGDFLHPKLPKTLSKSQRAIASKEITKFFLPKLPETSFTPQNTTTPGAGTEYSEIKENIVSDEQKNLVGEKESEELSEKEEFERKKGSQREQPNKNITGHSATNSVKKDDCCVIT